MVLVPTCIGLEVKNKVNIVQSMDNDCYTHSSKALSRVKADGRYL